MMDPLPSQSVAIDGLSVRRIREEKRLTQLYVAKVVGVTTDTVSRWENNRYPTIRRDNAVNLAEALEVELEEILKQESESGDSSDPLPVENKQSSVKLIIGAAVCVLILTVVFFLWRQFYASSHPVIKAKRIVPGYAADGSRILVQVRISCEKPLKGMILKEKFPPGWRMIESKPVASSVDSRAQGARWIFRNPGQGLNVYYILEISQQDSTAEQQQITGEVIANPDGLHSAVGIEQEGQIQIKSRHWADTNGDLVIDDLEILRVSELTETTGELNLGWDLIEEIWEAGKYAWNPEKKVFTPLPETFE